MGLIEYPIFCGKVINVQAIIEEPEVTFTIIHYVAPENNSKVERLKEEAKNSDGDIEKITIKLEELVSRAIIPIRIDPSTIIDAEIRTSKGTMNSQDYGRKRLCETYKLEVLTGRHEGLVYVKLIN